MDHTLIECPSSMETLSQSSHKDPTKARSWHCKVIVALLLAVAVAAGYFRFERLGDQSLWLDENCTFYVSHHLTDWPEGGPNPRAEVAHAPYFALLHLWTLVAGESSAGLRSFSAAMGVVGVMLLGWIAYRWTGCIGALVIVLLAAFHPLHIYYSREARVYMMWSVEITACLYFLSQAARTGLAKYWCAYVAIALLAVASHDYTILWLPSTIAVVWVAVNRRACVKQWFVAHAVLAALLLPYAYYSMLPRSGRAPLGWLWDTWNEYPPILAIAKSLWVMAPSGGYPSYLQPLESASRAWSSYTASPLAFILSHGSTVMVVVILIVGMVLRTPGTRAGHLPKCNHRRLVLWLVCSSVGFLITAWLYSALTRPVYVVGRYDFAAWPGITLALAVSITSIGRRRLVYVGVALLLSACSLLTWLEARSVPLSNDASERTTRMARHVTNEDLLVSTSMYRWFMTHEWHLAGFAPSIISFPPSQDQQLCWDNPRAELERPIELEANVELTVARILHEIDQGGRVWLLGGGEPSGPRWEVDKHFFAELQRRGISMDLVDEFAGLARLERSSDERNHDEP